MASPSLPNLKGRGTPLPLDFRLNVLAVGLLFAGVALGWVMAGVAKSLWLMAGGPWRGSGLSPRVANQWERAIVLRRAIHRLARSEPVLDHPVCRGRLGVDRSAHHRRRLTPSRRHLRHRARERRCGALLGGARPGEGRTGSAGLRERREFGGPDKLRDIIGRTSLTELLRGRERIEGLQLLIDHRSNPWGDGAVGGDEGRRHSGLQTRCHARRRRRARSRRVILAGGDGDCGSSGRSKSFSGQTACTCAP